MSGEGAPLTDFSRHLGFLEDGRSCIFLFHGVIDGAPTAPRNHNNKHLSRADFRDFLAPAAALGRPVSLAELVRDAGPEEEGAPPRFAVTFDDGFRNNLETALPVLRDLAIPATFYLTGRFVQENRMSWADRVDFAAAHYAGGDVAIPELDIATHLDEVASRRALMEAVRAAVKRRGGADPDRAADLVQDALLGERVWSSMEEIDRKLSPADVVELAGDPLVTVGGHSQTHGILSNLSDEDLRADIEENLDFLSRLLNREIVDFSYPEGFDGSYDDRAIALLKANGVTCAPSAIYGPFIPGDDPFHLRRVQVD